MACIAKNVVRVGLIGTVIGGTALTVASIADPPRFRAAVSQVGENLSDRIDNGISNPVALREQIRSLESQYPERITEVRGDLNELRQQHSALGRDRATSSRVIELADADLAKLDYGLDQASSAGLSGAMTEVAYGAPASARVVIVHQGERLSVEEAYARRNQVAATRNAYADRIADIDQDATYLQRQESQLVALLKKLETEHTNFQTQLFDLDRQIDAIARNERMIGQMEKRQKRLDQLTRYEVESLDQLKLRLDTLRSDTEQRLASLMQGSMTEDYESIARQQIARESVDRGPEVQIVPAPPSTTVEVHTDVVPADPASFLSRND